MDRQGSVSSRRDVSERPPPRGEPPHPPSSSRPQRAQTSQQTPLRRTPRRRQRRPYAPPLDRRYPAASSQPPAQPREPAASPQSHYRDVATWTSQDGVDPPVAYVSSRPWRRQERARVGTPPARLYRLFQGRTVADADRRANGACLPVPAGTRLCPCGAVMVHESHAQSKLHRRRTGDTLPPSRDASEERPSEAARAMLARAAREADFAQWLLTLATGHAARAGKMFPTRGDLHIAPFSDTSLYMEQLNKANFWYQQSFHGVDLSSLREAAVKEYFRQPVVDTFDVRICLAKSLRHTVDFERATESDLHCIEIPLQFSLLQSGELHGLAFWFDVAFAGSVQTVWLSTGPTQPLTHWYQVRCLLESPLFVQRGQRLGGRVVLRSNRRQSYDVDIELELEGGVRACNSLDLKNPFFRYTGQPPQPPPGCHETSPSEAYWATLDANGFYSYKPNGEPADYGF
ncbi:hypothetical protein HPB52_023428 [Rhipicephalus sanguineus]|uniref:type I protein arginine methyltransferase n=1 Tax=Rhipicephalus sanguineus TaxID=34632 RepID=A0A9D4PDJ9_RHISA|nr:hypothetical protein HPB52_023428 [Rhipicephalus sanguineus]